MVAHLIAGQVLKKKELHMEAVDVYLSKFVLNLQTTPLRVWLTGTESHRMV